LDLERKQGELESVWQLERAGLGVELAMEKQGKLDVEMGLEWEFQDRDEPPGPGWSWNVAYSSLPGALAISRQRSAYHSFRSMWNYTVFMN
jgi:hypothetical protein